MKACEAECVRVPPVEVGPAVAAGPQDEAGPPVEAPLASYAGGGAASTAPPAARWWSGKALIVVTFWGASFVATRVALEAFAPIALVAMRLLIGAGILMLVSASRGVRLRPPPSEAPVLAMLAVIGGAHLLIQAAGLQYTSAIQTGWIVGFCPVTIALASRVFLHHRIQWAGWLGVGIAAGGLALVMSHHPPDFTQARLGDLLQMSSCLTWTAYTLLAAGLVQRRGALPATTWGMAAAAGVLLVAAAMEARPLTGAVTPKALVALAFLAVVCSGLANYLWFAAQAEHGPTRTGAYIYLEPFVTVLTAWALAGEAITRETMLGGVTILAGVYVVSRGTRREMPHPQQRGRDEE